MKEEEKMLGKILKGFLWTVLVLILVMMAALGVFTIAEYRPAATETVTADHAVQAALGTGTI